MTGHHEDDDVRGLIDAWLDGALNAADERRVQRYLDEIPGGIEFLEGDLALGGALQRSLREGRGEPALSLSAHGRRWRNVAAAAAVLLLVSAGFMAGRLVGGDAVQPNEDATPMDVPAVPAGYQAAAGAEVETLGSVVRLKSGSLRLVATDAPRSIALAGARVEVDGIADLYQEPAHAGDLESHALVQVLEGRARVQPADGGREVLVDAGEPVVVTSSGVMSLGVALLARAGLESAPVTTEPLPDEDEPGALQARIGDLLEQNRRLTLQLDALRLRDGRELSASELFQAMAQAIAKDDASKDRCWSRAAGSMRSLTRMFLMRRKEALAALEAVVVDPSSTETEKALAIRLLGRLRVGGALDLVRPFLEGDSLTLKRAAVSALASQRDRRLRATLKEVFDREAEDVGVRVTAAGGLIRQGNYGEPLSWLMQTWRASASDPDLRRRIVGRVIHAPMDRIGDFLIEVAHDPDVAYWNFIPVIDLLQRIGGEDAERVLEGLSTSLHNDRLRARAASVLRMLRGQDD